MEARIHDPQFSRGGIEDAGIVSVARISPLPRTHSVWEALLPLTIPRLSPTTSTCWRMMAPLLRYLYKGICWPTCLHLVVSPKVQWEPIKLGIPLVVLNWSTFFTNASVHQKGWFKFQCISGLVHQHNFHSETSGYPELKYFLHPSFSPPPQSC